MGARARTVAVLGALAILGTPAVADAAPDEASVGPPQTGGLPRGPIPSSTPPRFRRE